MSIEAKFPASLRERFERLDWEPVTIGESEARVYRTEKFVLKIEQLGRSDGTLFEEKSRMEWLKGQVRVAEIVAYARDETLEYLISTRLPGVDAAQTTWRSDPTFLVTLLGGALREFHQGVTIADCPFDMRLQRRLDKVPSALLAELIENKPEEDLVFTHGDYCLPNIILDEEKVCVTGFVDLGRAGIADRYTDLALGLRSINYNLGEGYDDVFLKAYGCISAWDRRKIEFYQMLDEL